MSRSTRPTSRLLLSCLCAGLLTTAGFAGAQNHFSQAEKNDLPSFQPTDASVSVQKFQEKPELGNTLLTIQLSAADLSRLSGETGRTDFFAMGPDEGEAPLQVILRDDGVFPDAAAGDRVFSAWRLPLSARLVLENTGSGLPPFLLRPSRSPLARLFSSSSSTWARAE
ncbi:MAG: hypothetical protein AAF772_20530, partial [Acidobacteriota bacterium]